MIAPIDMTSPNWQRLNDEERYDRIEPICRLFVQRLAGLPNINHIGHTPFNIFVGTALPHGTRINDIASEFLGVPVEQDPVREDMDRFLATWKAVLERIGEWPSDRVAAFANDRHICFRSAWCLHDSPLEFIGSQLLPEELRGVLQINDIRRVIGAIESGIATDSDRWHPDLDTNYDWVAAKRRVDDIIAEFRAEHLPTCDRDGDSNET